MLLDMIAVAHVEQDLAARPQHSANVAQHRFVVARALEIAETVAENERGIEAFIRRGNCARIAFVKPDRQAGRLGTEARLPEKKCATIDPGEISETAPRPLPTMPALPTADVENACIFGAGQQFEETVD